MNSIIFLHKGNDYYLSLALKMASITNPNIDIILLGDDSNKSLCYGHVKHYLIYDFIKRAKQFEKIYIHHSPNPYDYELFCFQRWLIICEFIKNNKQYNDKFLYCDSDTLLFDDVSSEFDKMEERFIACEYKGSPAFTFFNKDVLDVFCEKLEWMFSSKEGTLLRDDYVRYLENNQKKYGISDMSFFSWFMSDIGEKMYIRADKVKDCGWDNINPQGIRYCYDHNFNCSKGFSSNLKGQKKFVWKEGRPYAYSYDTNSLVLFKGIHFQGRAKKEMIRFASKKFSVGWRLWKKYYLNYMLDSIVFISKFVNSFFSAFKLY